VKLWVCWSREIHVYVVQVLANLYENRISLMDSWKKEFMIVSFFKVELQKKPYAHIAKVKKMKWPPKNKVIVYIIYKEMQHQAKQIVATTRKRKGCYLQALGKFCFHLFFNCHISWTWYFQLHFFLQLKIIFSNVYIKSWQCWVNPNM
jgi:hypothetical protein